MAAGSLGPQDSQVPNVHLVRARTGSNSGPLLVGGAGQPHGIVPVDPYVHLAPVRRTRGGLRSGAAAFRAADVHGMQDDEGDALTTGVSAGPG